MTDKEINQELANGYKAAIDDFEGRWGLPNSWFGLGFKLGQEADSQARYKWFDWSGIATKVQRKKKQPAIK